MVKRITAHRRIGLDLLLDDILIARNTAIAVTIQQLAQQREGNIHWHSEEQARFVLMLQLVVNVLSSSAAGVVLANLAALVAGDASLAVLGQTLQTQVPLIALTAVVSFLAAFVKR